MSKVYVVNVPGLLIKNGTIAKYGQEVPADHINDVSARLEEGYVVSKSDFEKAQKEAEQDLAKVDSEKDELFAKYKSAFSVDAPESSSLADIKKAIQGKKAIEPIVK